MTEPTLEVIQSWLEVIHRARRTVLCLPEDEARIREAIQQTEYPGLFEVEVSSLVPRGQILVVNKRALEADLRESLQPLWPSGATKEG